LEREGKREKKKVTDWIALGKKQESTTAWNEPDSRERKKVSGRREAQKNKISDGRLSRYRLTASKKRGGRGETLLGRLVAHN